MCPKAKCETIEIAFWIRANTVRYGCIQPSPLEAGS